ncbi:MAG TPA: SOS response-associated peptidase [Ktedonobacterales bacterium]|jgi:putative SOS response-associated peptidase YedK|nr:SOS response-associated peptidase [Ktedonobacterales bacterium]
MCGRYEIVDGKRIFVRFKVATTSAAQTRAVQELLPNLDVRPSEQVPVILPDHELRLMRWGLVPYWAKDEKIGYSTFNAREEGIERKASFKRPLRSQRILIPASAFFEWQGKKGHKTKYRIARRDGDLIGFAGLYDIWTAPGGDELTSCTIITTLPNKELQPIHDRMPVILLPEDEDEWLNPDRTEPEDILPYLKSYPDGLLTVMRAA